MKSCRFFSCAFGLIFLWAFSSSLQSQTSAPQWVITCPSTGYVDLAAGCWRGNLEGYTDKMSVKQGETIAFKVSVLQPGQYSVDIYRVGASTTGDQDMTNPSLGPFNGVFEPLHDAAGNPISPSICDPPFPMEYRNGCNWPTAFTVTIPTSWPSGFYYALLTKGSETGRIPFVVKEDFPGSTSKILCVIAWNTYQAYNYWGGGSLYWCTGQYESPELDGQNQQVIRTVSFQRPFGLHYHWDDSNNPCGTAGRYQFVNQLGQFDHRERQFINWAESNNYLIEYCIDFDVHDQGPSLLNNYKLVVFPGHSEYWSNNQRVNVRNFRNAGGNLAFFAANNCYWKVDFQASNTKIFCNKENNLYWWRNDPVEGPESNLIGIQFGGVNTHCDGSGVQGPNFVTQASHWLFNSTGLTNGAVLGQGQYHDCPSLNIDPLAAGEADMKAVYDPPNANVEILARRKIRNLFAGDTLCPADVHYDDHTLISNDLYSDVTYYEDQQGNARVFAAGAHGWCNALYGADGTTMGVITRNLLDHFSYKKFRGNIYTNLIWGDEAPVENGTILDGDTYILAGKTLSLTNNFLLTINSGVTLYVQGTLVIGSGVTITGGGKVVVSGGGVIQASTSSSATANNSSRKIVRDASGNYHLVFDAGGEICYEKWSNEGTELREFRRLSAGNGNNQFPAIAERSGRLYVFWQRKTGTNTYATHFRRFYNTSWEALRTINGSITSNSDLTPSLAVSTPTASFEMMVVYRTNSGLRFRRAVDTLGVTWAAAADVTTNTGARNPSLIYKANDFGYFNVTWDDGSNIKHQIYYGDTSWGTATTVSTGTSAYNHQYPSYSLSANNDRHIVWQAFEAVDYQQQAVYHNKNLTNIFTVFASTNWDHLKPNGTGHTGGTLTALCNDSNNNVRKRYCNGSYWQSGSEGTVIASNSIDPSVSISNPPGAIAKAVWRSTGSAPYALTIGPSGGLSKSNADENWVYHRRVVFSLNDSTIFALQMGAAQILTANGKNDQSFSLVSDQDSIKTNDLAATLKLSNILLPANADSLVFNVKVYGQNAGALRVDPDKSLDLAFDLLSVETGVPLLSIKLKPLNNTGTSHQALRLVFPVQAARGKQVHLAPVITNINLGKANGALVHVYEVLEEGAQKARSETSSLIAATPPASFFAWVFPNPFNPSTQIHFHLPNEGLLTIHIYDVNGRIVKELSRGFRKAGDHVVTWDGRDTHGKTVASGVYFSHVSFEEERKVSKMTLLR